MSNLWKLPLGTLGVLFGMWLGHQNVLKERERTLAMTMLVLLERTQLNAYARSEAEDMVVKNARRLSDQLDIDRWWNARQ